MNLHNKVPFFLRNNLKVKQLFSVASAHLEITHFETSTDIAG